MPAGGCCNARFQCALCPLWVKSRRSGVTERCPLYPRKRTLSDTTGMSALCQKRTYAPQQKTPLFDHLVGAQQERLGEFQPKRLGGPNIDHQFDFRRLQHWQVGGLFAFEDAADIAASLTNLVRNVPAVAHQAASPNHVTEAITCRNRVTRCQRHELLAGGAAKKRIVANNERRRPLLNNGCKRYVDVAFTAGVDNENLLSDFSCSLLRISQSCLQIRIVRVEEHGNDLCSGHELTHQLQPLRQHFAGKIGYPREVAGRSAEAGDETIPDRVATDGEDDGNCRGRGPGRNRCGKVVGKDGGHLIANQLGSEVGKAIILVRIPPFDGYIASFDIAQVVQALAERCQAIRHRWLFRVQPSDNRDRCLLRPRRERPCHRATEQRYELAESHSITSSASAS